MKNFIYFLYTQTSKLSDWITEELRINSECTHTEFHDRFNEYQRVIRILENSSTKKGALEGLRTEGFYLFADAIQKKQFQIVEL